MHPMQPVPTKPVSSDDSKIRKGKWILLFVCLVLILLLLVVMLWMNTDVKMTLDKQKVDSQSSGKGNSNGEDSSQKMEVSCRDLRNESKDMKDGVFNIKPTEEHGSIQVYCDMTTDGGGWTLVASVHDDNIQKKCDSNDMWSFYGDRTYAARSGVTNWGNDVTFGSVNDATKKDYKNIVYSTMNASDVMIWHVRAGTSLSEMKSSSSLRYRTNERFLSKYGGNLKTLYKSKYNQSIPARTTRVLNALVQRASVIKSQIPNWNEYSYSSHTDRISLSTMYYIYGNRITFTGPCTYNVQYGSAYRCPNSEFQVASAKSHPFFAVAAISNQNKQTSSYSTQVYTRRHRYDSYLITSNNITEGNFKLQYNMVQFYEYHSATVAEFHFLISNVKDWSSDEPTSYAGIVNSNSYYDRTNRFQASGYPANVVMGYTLLSKTTGTVIVTEEEARNVSREILMAMREIPDLFREFRTENYFAIVPVTFDKGSKDDVVNMVPRNYRPFVEPGFIQFRAYNGSGFPNALCPGVKVDSAFPEYICIGGISDDIGPYGTCGDFSGWEGTSKDVIKFKEANGSAHSYNDIFSTILIFYR